jgi:hypothetical protein
MVTVEEVMNSLKEFIKEMASKYAVLDRPPAKSEQEIVK